MPIWRNNCNPRKLNLTTVVLTLAEAAEVAPLNIYTARACASRDDVIRAGVHLYMYHALFQLCFFPYFLGVGTG